MPLMRLEASTVIVPEAKPAEGAEPEAGKKAGGRAPEEATTGVAKPAVTADVGAVLIAYVVVALGAAAGILFWKWRDPASFTPGDGISVFAPLYILAQAIERFIEPFSTYLGSAAPDDQKKDKQQKPEALEAVQTALHRGDADAAAKAQRVVDKIRRNTAVITWGVASLLGMVLCGLFGLFMLRLVGFSGVPGEVDIVISGLAVGSGTKPLHDLISNIQKSKEQKEDPPEKKGA